MYVQRNRNKTLTNQLNAKLLPELLSLGRTEDSSVHIDILRSLVRIRQVGHKHLDASHLELDFYMSYVSIEKSYNTPLHATKINDI